MTATNSSASVVLFNPQSSVGAKPILPMSLLALGAVLEGRHAYTIVDGNLEPESLTRLDGIIRAIPRDPLLAVTVMPGPQLERAVPLCKELKRRHPNLIVVWGGYFPSEHWRVCVKEEFVDFVLVGHAERAFGDLVDSVREDLDPSGIVGLAWVDATGRLRGGRMPPVPDPEQLPPWNLERVPVDRYLRSTFLGSRTLGYNSYYGCPFRCNFCAVVNLVDGGWKSQSAERVARAIERYKANWGVNAVEFVDNNFFVRESRTLEFAERIAPLEIGWWGEARVDTLLQYSEATWDQMKRSGLRMVFLGAESGSMETLQRMEKGGRLVPEMTIELASKMRKKGIVPEFSFVLGAPPDPDLDVHHTLRFIRRIKRVNPAAEIILYLYTPVPLGGALFDSAKQAGFRFPSTLDGWVSPRWAEFSQRRSDGLPWIGSTLRRRIRDFETVLAAYHPTTTDMRLGKGWRSVLRLCSSWRYRFKVYRLPLELRLLQRVVRYQRPEVSGF